VSTHEILYLRWILGLKIVCFYASEGFLSKHEWADQCKNYNYGSFGVFFCSFERDVSISLDNPPRCKIKCSCARIAPLQFSERNLFFFFTCCFRSLPVLRYYFPKADLGIFKRKWICFMNLFSIWICISLRNTLVSISSSLKFLTEGKRKAIYFITNKDIRFFC